MKKILFAGGGTAGHVEPALAVADAISNMPGDWDLQFLGTEAGLESKLVPQRGYKLITIAKVALPRKISFALLTFPFRYLIAVRQVSKALTGADALIGFGGYVSGAAYLAARAKSIPILVHEANAKPGWANRLGRRFAKVVAINFTVVKENWPEAIVTGIPIRDSIVKLATEESGLRATVAAKYQFDPALPTVAIFGGSQGSAHMNKAVADYLAKNSMEKNEKSAPGRDLQIIHAVGLGNPLPNPLVGYRPLPYFDDMAGIYAISDILITRSGAVTCAEILTIGKFAILVPLPHGNGEQQINAMELVNSGNATLVSNAEFDGAWLTNNLADIVATRSHGAPISKQNLESANRIAELVVTRLLPVGDSADG